MNRKGADLDLLEQFQIYESVLKHEDGDESGPIAGGNIENLRYVTTWGTICCELFEDTIKLKNLEQF